MHDVIELYLFAVRRGDRPLAAALGRALRSDPSLRDPADRALQETPRGPGRWSVGADLSGVPSMS
jgi:hypothetical protein